MGTCVGGKGSSSCWARAGFSTDTAFAFHDLKPATLFLLTLNYYTSMQTLLLPQCGRHPTKSGICILCPFRSPGYLKQSLLPSLASPWKPRAAVQLVSSHQGHGSVRPGKHPQAPKAGPARARGLPVQQSSDSAHRSTRGMLHSRQEHIPLRR